MFSQSYFCINFVLPIVLHETTGKQQVESIVSGSGYIISVVKPCRKANPFDFHMA